AARRQAERGESDGEDRDTGHPGSVARRDALASRPARWNMDAITLRNRLLIATTMWKEATNEPLPRMPPGDPAEQIRAFELKLVDILFTQATPSTARDVADRTWDLVHDRPEDDPVKQRVVEGHEALARLAKLGE
ncbi:MAG: hypothetical protein JWN32_228, partial [Solirubrobacterales bacterium]|nr:hypothetical protein [Solirubrobacterales bacterium]